MSLQQQNCDVKQENIWSFKHPEGRTPLVRHRVDAERRVSETFPFSTAFKANFPEHCHQDGTFTCPNCGGPLKIFMFKEEKSGSKEQYHGFGLCEGRCQHKKYTRIKEKCEHGIEPTEDEATGNNIKVVTTKTTGVTSGRVLNVWDLCAIKKQREQNERWNAHRALNHLAARSGLAITRSRNSVEHRRQRELIIHAIWYVLNGFKVFPVHSMVDHEGGSHSCSCDNPECPTPGKHPVTTHGVKDATDSIPQILEWWSQYPTANIGIATGQVSNIWVLDVDAGPDKDGMESLDALIAQHGTIPDTPQQLTGGGGIHYLFRYPRDRTIRNNNSGALGQHLDIKSDGGYIVAAPSNHKSGQRYEWEVCNHLTDMDPVDAPAWLLNLLTETLGSQAHNATKFSLSFDPNSPDLPDGFAQGQRDEGIFSFACSRVARGMTRSQVMAQVLALAQKCKPPYPQEEAVRKVASAFDTHARNHPGWTEPTEPLPARDRTPLSNGDPSRGSCDLTPPPTDAEDSRARCYTLIDEIAKEPTCAVRNDNLNLLAWAQDHDSETWIACKVALKRQGILRDVERALKKRKFSVVSGEPPKTPVKQALENLGIPILPELTDLTLPPATVIDVEGMGIMAKTADGTVRKTISPRIILPIRRFSNLQVMIEQIEIAYWSGTHWKRTKIDRASAVIGHKLAEASNQGIPVGGCDAAFLAQFLHKFILENEATLPVQAVRSSFGFAGTREQPVFLWGDEQISLPGAPSIIFYPTDAGDAKIARGLCAKGTLPEWIAHVWGPCVPYAVARLTLYASAATPLVYILGTQNIGLDVSGRTSLGKTTITNASASLWGDPNVLVVSWNTTLVGLERQAALLNDLPCHRDDSKQVDRNKVNGFIYSIINGTGRTRGSKQGTAPTLEWRTILLSNGEAALVSYIQDAGGRVRIISIRRTPFGPATDKTRRLVDSLNLNSRHYFGTAGPAFVRWLIDNRERWPEFQDRFKAKAQTYLSTISGPGARLADSAAVIGLGGELFHEALELPQSYRDPFIDDNVWGLIEQEIASVDADIRALRDLREWAVQNIHRFHDPTVDFEPVNPQGGWVGRWKKGGEWESMSILPLALKEFCLKWGYDYDAIIEAWADRKWLTGDQRSRRTQLLWLGGKAVRHHTIRREAFDIAEYGISPELPTEEAEEEIDYPKDWDAPYDQD